ncbi:MAG: hypothetical protein ACE5EU_00455 [Paracoccaceae bacterium]
MRPFSNTKVAATGLALMAALSLALPSTTVSAGGLRFMVFGDAPYTDEQIVVLEDTVAPAIRDAGFEFLIHLGDLKGGRESCTDALIGERYKQLMALHPGRVFYTPGDNEWTDCDRPGAAQRFSELERLDHLRSLIASTSMNLPDDWHYATQPNFPENARWTQGNVMFATVHIVSTNNGREEIFLDELETTLDLVDARDRANLTWLGAAFAAARESNSGAVVIATQADVTKRAGSAPCSAAVRIRCDAFAAFRDQLLRLAAGFKKPVLLVHGDTNPFCLDREFGGDTAPLLWRLNALGDYSEVDATVISVAPENAKKPFVIKPLMTGASVSPKCS